MSVFSEDISHVSVIITEGNRYRTQKKTYYRILIFHKEKYRYPNTKGVHRHLPAGSENIPAL